MQPWLLVTVSALFLLLSTAAWAVSVFHIPGNWLMLIFALLYGWAEGFKAMKAWVFAMGLGLFLVAECLEWAAGYLGTKSFGGSRWGGLFAILGAVLGAVLGAGFGYGLGAIPGTLLGAFMGALVPEFVRQRHAGKALWAGLGAAIGRAFGLSLKLGAGGVFLALLYVRVIWTLLDAARPLS
jgi:uncharacterized protein YqgC (DUF456 family)